MRITPTSEKKSQTPPKKSFFRLFLSEIRSRRCRLSRTTSDPAQKSGKFQAKIVFFLFFRRKIWHDFVTPFSTFANIKGSLPTNSTTPDRLRCRARPSDEIFHGFLRRKCIIFCARHLVVIYTPKEAHSRIFVTGGQYSRDKCWPKHNSVLGRPACIIKIALQSTTSHWTSESFT